jgi:hypothetical protein
MTTNNKMLPIQEIFEQGLDLYRVNHEFVVI